MRFIRLVFISIIVLGIALIFVFSLFPSHIRISRVINIPASKEKIAHTINDLQTWDEWNELTSHLSSKRLSNPTSGPGAFIESGEMRVMITASTTDSIATNWQENKKKQFTGGFNIIQIQDGPVTVEWYFDFHFRWYPWEKLGSMFYDKQLGPLMEKSLANLKSYIGNH